mmetsp:Transcript_8457/g.14272  ORF Transcript_8457/g.14272 Transcript_8457/m.14272 type:complete len:121 (+) Transcript_8457:151-513(+)
MVSKMRRPMPLLLLAKAVALEVPKKWVRWKAWQEHNNTTVSSSAHTHAHLFDKPCQQTLPGTSRSRTSNCSNSTPSNYSIIVIGVLLDRKLLPLTRPCMAEAEGVVAMVMICAHIQHMQQ